MPQPTFCTYFNQSLCRSCSAIELGYSEQLQRKEQVLTRAGFNLGPTVPSPLQGFRNRAKMLVTGKSECPIIGLLGEGDSLDSGRELLACPIHHAKLNELIAALPAFIREFNLTPYLIAERKGELKALISFYSPHSNEMYLRFVLRSRECVSRLKKLLPKLQSAFPELVCVTANLQPIPHAILEGPEEIFITERQSIDHRMGAARSDGGFTFKLSPQAFVQTNVMVAEKLYETAAEWVAGVKPESFMELFCGQGAFSFFSARSFKRGLGIDISEQGIAAANLTAKVLGLSHLEFEASDAAAVGERIKSFAPELVLVNPPRKGLGKSLELILESGSENVIYSSCSHESLISDLGRLGGKYEVVRAQIFDLFPHTDHFETLVELKRR